MDCVEDVERVRIVFAKGTKAKKGQLFTWGNGACLAVIDSIDEIENAAEVVIISGTAEGFLAEAKARRKS